MSAPTTAYLVRNTYGVLAVFTDRALAEECAKSFVPDVDAPVYISEYPLNPTDWRQP
jgi:hypothetical protein